MASFAEWVEQEKKKKKKEELTKQERIAGGEQHPAAGLSFSDYAKQVLGRDDFDDPADIAPVKKTTESDDKEKWYEGWFQKGATEDGATIGNIAKSGYASTVDINENVATGVIGSGEKLVDAGLMLGAAGAEQQMKNTALEAALFDRWFGGIADWFKGFSSDYASVKKEPEKEKTKEEKFNETLHTYDDVIAEMKAGTEEAVAKDLYDEKKIAQAIISGLPEKITGINVEEDSFLANKTDSLAQSAGQMGVTVGLNALAPGMGTAFMFGTAFGAESENALREGATYDEALVSSYVSALGEVLTEQLSGGIRLPGVGTLDDLLTKQISQKITNKYVSAVLQFGLDAFGEGAEEWIAEDIGAFGRWMTYQSEEELKNLLWSDDALNAKIEAFIGGAALGGSSNVVKGTKSVISSKLNSNKLNENEQKVADAVTEARIAEEEKGGKKLTNKQKADIEAQVREDLEKGRIDTDTIESVLGMRDGDNYKSYTDTLASEEAIVNEYNELADIPENELSRNQRKRLDELEGQIEDAKAKTGSKQFKQQYDEEVSGIVKNSRFLTESYNEKARRGQAFEVDLSQYEGKEKEILQGFMDKGQINNTNQAKDFWLYAAKVGAEKGLNITSTTTEEIIEMETKKHGKEYVERVFADGVVPNAYIMEDGTLAINVKSVEARRTILGHEITHTMEKGAQYEAMQNFLFAYAEGKMGTEAFQKRLATVEEMYKDVEGANAKNELTADLVGEYLYGDPDFVRHLSTKDQNLFQKIWSEIKYLYKMATAGSQEARELEKIKRMFEQEYRNSGKVSGDSKFSLSAQTNTDNTGKQLTKEQAEYFKDSKVRDENGDLLVVYHGTTNGGYTIFSPMFSDDKRSIFFTDNPDTAKSYSDSDDVIELPKGKDKNRWTEVGRRFGKGQEGIYPLYLNLTNPLIIDCKGSKWSAVPYNGVGWVEFRYRIEGDNIVIERQLPGKDVTETTYSLDDMGGIEAHFAETLGSEQAGDTTRVLKSRLQNSVKSSTVFAEIWDSKTKSFAEGYTTRNISEIAQKEGYDGVILKNVHDQGVYADKTTPNTSNVYIAFNANQVKSTANAKPTGDADIRYSLSSMGTTFFGNESMPADAFAEGNYKQAPGYQAYVNECLNNYKQTRGDSFDEAVARKEIEDSIDGIVRVALAAKKAGYDIFDDGIKRSKKDSKNRLLFSSLEPNSDYFTSSDISTICDKRQNFADIYDEIVRAEEAKGVPQGKRFFDNINNYFYLHGILAEKGLTQPCRECYVESMRKNLAPMANAFLRLVNETDANNTANDQLYQQKGKNKGALKTNNAALRERVLDILAENGMSASDLTVETLTTEDGLAQLRIQAPLVYEAFNSFYGQSKPKMPKSATPFRFGELTALLTDERGKIKQSLVDKINATGGFRLQSYSDFQIQNYTDVLQTIFEAGTLGLSGHAYTKVPAFLEATEGTNLKRNISIFMYKDGNEWKLDRNDSFPYTLEEIYDIVKADKTGNTSIIAVSQNEDMSAWIMANDNIGYFIPFHKSGLKMATVRDTIVREDGREIKGYTGTKDHTRQQAEVWATTTADHKALTNVKKGINIYEFWDFANEDNLSKNELIEKNVKRYIDECEKSGYLPKFREYVMNNGKVLNSTLAYAKELGFVSQDATIEDISFEYKGYTIPYGYYKCLGDFGMFTPDGKASSHDVLSLNNYDFDKAEQFFADAETLRRNEILQQFANDGERQRYADSDLTAGELADIIKQKRAGVVEDVMSRYGAPTQYSLSRQGGTRRYGRGDGAMAETALVRDDVAPVQDSVQDVAQDVAPVAPTVNQEIDRMIDAVTDKEFAYLGYDPNAQPETDEEAKRRLSHISDMDAPPETEAPYYGEESQPMTADDPFESRQWWQIDRNTKAFTYENPDARPFFAAEADVMLGDLSLTQPAERWYNDKLYYDTNGEKGFFGVKRHTSSEIASLLDDYGFTYAQIEEGLNAIIEGNSKVNNKAAKHIEAIINDRLLKGYKDFYSGEYVPPNQGYIEWLNGRQNAAEYAEGAATLTDADAPPVAEDYAPVAETPTMADTLTVEDVMPIAEAPVSEQYEAIKPKPEAQPRMVRADTGDTKPGEKQRKWVGTSTESEAVNREVLPDDLDQTAIHYQPVPNKVTLGKANARLGSMGYDASVTYFNSQFAGKKVSLEDIALGERLIQEAIKKGDTKTAGELIQNVAILGTELGQKVQALSIIKRLTPEGQLKMLQKMVERGKTKGDKAYDGVELPQESVDKILRSYNEDGSYDQDKLNAAVEDAKQKLADQMKVSVMDKVNAWRYLSMLGNPKTHIRNLMSNVAMKGTVAVKNAIARTVEDIAPIKERTKTWKSATDEVKAFAEKTTAEMENVLRDGGKYSEDASIKAKRKIFKSHLMNWLSDKNSDLLSGEDWRFSKPAFKNAFAEYLTANGIQTEEDIMLNPEIVEKARAYATEQSQIATFRQYSWLANKINEIEQKNAATQIAVGAVLPFKKTPINIAKAGLNYSPLGFAKTLTYDIAQVKKGNMESSTLIDHLAQNVTGSALTLVGYMFASMGLLSGAGEDDKEGEYDYQLGEQSYAVNIGGKSYSLSWLSPVAMPLFVGANAYEQLVEGKEWNGDVVVQTLAQTLDPLSEMSFLSSLDSVLSSYDSGIEKFAGIGESMVQNYVTQFVPTLSSQIATVTDDTKRSTKVSGDSGFRAFDETINKLKLKIPGLRQTLEPSTDIWGNDVKLTENVVARAVETFIAPYAVRENIATEIDAEIKGLYSETGDGGIIPSIPDNYVNFNDEKYKMSAEDYTAFKKSYGQTSYEMLSELFNTSTYRNAGADEQADLINRVYDYARDEAKRELLAKQGVEYTNATEDGVKVYKENAIKGAIYHDVTPDEYSFMQDYPEKHAFFKENGISYESYKNADEDGKRAYSWAYENPGKYTMSKAISDDFLTYYQYKSDLFDIKADKDANGDTITGSGKDKKIEYINSLDLDYGQKIILFRSLYDSKTDKANYNADIVEYLNSRDDISYEEMVTILEELDFTVYDDGTVTW